MADDARALCNLVDLGSQMWSPRPKSGDLASRAAATIREHRKIVERRDANERSSRLEAREKARRESAGDLDVPEDASEDIDTLETKWNVCYSNELMKCASTIGAFGPRSGCSDVRRLLRALRFGLTTSNECNTLTFASSDSTSKPSYTQCRSFAEWCASDKRGELEESSSSSTEAKARASNASAQQKHATETSSGSVLFFGSGQGMTRTLDDVDFRRSMESWSQENRSRILAPVDVPIEVKDYTQYKKRCRCGTVLDAQFGDCDECEERLAFQQ